MTRAEIFRTIVELSGAKSQFDFAKENGLNYTQVNGYMTSYRQPKEELLFKLAEKYNLKITTTVEKK